MGIIILIIVLFFGFQFFMLYKDEIKYILKNPKKVFINAKTDIYKYFKYKKWRVCNNYGYLNIYSAYSNQVFGCGKTLTMVKDAISLYKKYNNVDIYDEENHEWVTQKVHLISNIKLFGVPYYEFIDENQFTEFDKYKFDKQDITVYLIDEMQALYDSRSFKDNISKDFMEQFLQCRKNKIIILATAQRFSRCDKFLRELCSTLITCQKHWRFIKCIEFNANTVEHCQDLSLVKPLNSGGVWLSTDQDYKSYDTQEHVKRLLNTEYISNDEILNNRDFNNDLDLIKKRLKPTKKRKGAA